MSSEVLFAPASRKQEMFINSQAFLTIFGGASGSGKTYLSLMRFLFYVEEPNFVGYVFRKNATDLKNGGGAFREAIKMFTAYDSRVKYTKQPMCIYFPSGATINFTGLDGEAGMNAIQGIQISAAMLDESTHFTEEEVMWIISRLRTSANMNPCLWLTCNPDPDSFIRKWLEPFHLYPMGTYVDGELVEGRPKPEADGVIRYYIRNGNEMVWGTTAEELIEQYGHLYPKDENGKTTCRPRTFSFISATCLDNPPLLAANPEYVSNLMSLPRITKERLLKGNWFAREEESGYFKRQWTPIIRDFDGNKVKRYVRAFDLAATVPSEANHSPDFTASVLLARMTDDSIVVVDVEQYRKRAGEVEDSVFDTIKKDIEYYGATKYQAYLPQDPGASGIMVKKNWLRLAMENGVPLRFSKVSTTKGKLASFLPFSATAESGDTVKVLENNEWNDKFFNELESFDRKRSTATKKDDIVDSCSLAFNVIATSKELPKISASKLKMR